MNNVQYINILFLLNKVGNVFTEGINIGRSDKLKKYFDEEYVIPIETSLCIIDLDKVRFTEDNIKDGTNWLKTSFIKKIFDKLITEYANVKFLFVNTEESITNYILDKDFVDKSNVWVLTFISNNKISDNNNKTFKKTNGKETNPLDIYNLLKENNTDQINIENASDLENIIDKLIALRMKNILDQYNCIITFEGNENEKHILNSTPVHVNKYINLKPLIEDSNIFYEVCFYLYRQIYLKFSIIPDFLVAPSKNAMCIASGMSMFFETSDIIILNQISPITAFNNYSNVDQIKSNAKYVIIEDFYCMGTEIKTVEGILWSKGVEKINIATFPLVSSNVHETKQKFSDKKIFPLCTLDNSDNYYMFTNTCCPVCNGIKRCFHRSHFKIL